MSLLNDSYVELPSVKDTQSYANDMNVMKRSGILENVSFDKILQRIRNLGDLKTIDYGELTNIKYTQLVMKVISQLYDGIQTSHIDELSAQQCASMSTIHPDYGELSSRIVVSNHQKNTSGSFSKTMDALYHFHDHIGKHCPIISDTLHNISVRHKEILEREIDYDRDFIIDYFGFKTLERAYLMRVKNIIVERPQDMWMRVSIGIHGEDIDSAIETYHLLSQKYFIHATPTLFNAGTNRPQLSSCYLLALEEDSIKGIYNTLGDCAAISKWAGGIGLHIHNVRATGTHIRGTNGTSNGIVPMLRVFNNTARYVDQCIDPETILYTTDGPKQIRHCVSGKTSIFTTNGPEIIENVLEHPYNDEVIYMSTYDSYRFNKLMITPEHPIYVLRDISNHLDFDAIKQQLTHHTIKPEWIDANDVEKDDFMILKIPEYEKDIDSISKEDCHMYGILLATGNMTNNLIITHVNLRTEEHSELIQFVKHYLTLYCIDYDEKIINETTTSVSQISWNRTIQLPFRYHSLYDENENKRIQAEWLNLPISKSKHIIEGLIKSGGCIEKDITFVSTSNNLVESIRYLLLRMATPTSVKSDIGYIETRNGNISYVVKIPITTSIGELLDIETNVSDTFFVYDYLIYLRISSIQKSKYTGTLYDLQMKDTHNYMTNHGIVHNGGGKRNGSFAMYMEPWHADIRDFLELRKNHGDEERRARDLFYALWIPDLFMERVKSGGNWTLFCPDKCPGLSDAYGEKFNQLYETYEKRGLGNETILARDLWFSILDSQIETGTPYLLYKDACNEKSNQKNLGVIKSSNLCTEIIEYSDKDESAVCNLASIGLPRYVVPSKKIDSIEKVVLYGKEGCPYCVMSKAFLKRYNIEYDEIVLDDDKERKAFYKEQSRVVGIDIHSVPVLYVNDKFIGGYTELVSYLRPRFDFDKLLEVVGVVTRNLNKIIDINFYPTTKTRRSNKRHRPIGIGVQGLADVYAMMGYTFDSPEAVELNKAIFETIYYGSMCESNELSKSRCVLSCLKDTYNENWKFASPPKEYYDTPEDKPNMNGALCNKYELVGDTELNRLNTQVVLNMYRPTPEEIMRDVDVDQYGSYSSFKGSPLSQGLFQFDLWNKERTRDSEKTIFSKLVDYDWDVLRDSVMKYGVRNSLLLAPMPTASTSQILGNNECFEPFTSNIYARRTIAGEFVIVNKHLMRDLTDLGWWNEENKNKIILNKGSIQACEDIPKFIRDKYKTVWELSMKTLIEHARDRGRFICQSQSMNLWMENPTYDKLTAMHFYGWQQGLKTGIYYLRTRAKAAPQQFTIDPNMKGNGNGNVTLKVEEKEESTCESCSG
mgnify:CR=1 FL=1